MAACITFARPNAKSKSAGCKRLQITVLGPANRSSFRAPSGALSATSGGTLGLVQSGSNSGPITANGGTVYLDGSWTNSGPITGSGGGLVSLYNGGNSGLITATGSTVNFGGAWSDSAAISLTASHLNFYGSGVITAPITGDAASAVEFYGSITTVNLTGGARVGLSGGTLYNGTLTLDAGQALHVDNPGTLSNLTLNGNLELSSYDNLSVNVTNGLTLNGTAFVGSANHWCGIVFTGTQTIGGTGSIVFGNVWPNYLTIVTPAGLPTITH